MKANEKIIRNNKGITLVALVVTIIVLLILAAVSLSMVFSQDGIFSRAEQVVDKHGQAKARETLELALGEAQMQKYEQGLTDEQLTEKINAIGEEIEERETPDISQAIVDGYIFSVDRTVPKILDYIGPANGVIITATVSGNNGWLKPGEAKVSVTGKIKTYSGGTITTVSATKGSEQISGFSIDGDGKYIIDNITADTTIAINATDSNNETGNKIIPITVKIDNKLPVVDTLNATTEGLTIKFSATGHDNESGLKDFTYEITSTEDTALAGIPANKRKGTFTQGQTITIDTTPTGDRDETTYKMTVTASDNCDNKSTAKTEEVTVIDGLTLAQAKELVNADTLQRYIGTRILDYNPEAEGVWRIFYYDADNYFGDGEGTLYLKRDYDIQISLDSYREYIPTDNDDIMRKMNPMWANSENGKEIDLKNEHCVAYLCDSSQWTKYKTDEAKYAIGAPSVELFIKSYNVYKGTNALKCSIHTINGYGVATGNGSIFSYVNTTINGGKGDVFCKGSLQWLASPNCAQPQQILDVRNSSIGMGNGDEKYGICPIAVIEK